MTPMASGRDLYGEMIRTRTYPDLTGKAHGAVPVLRRNVEQALETLPLPNGRQNNTHEPVARPHETDWQMGPQFKDKPGSQGTLFSGGTKYSSDARYPRGYTPERLQGVANRIVPPSGHPRDDKGVQMGTQSSQYKDMAYGYKDREARIKEVVSREPMRRIVDTVARSTVPLEHLEDKAGGQLSVKSVPLGESGGLEHAGEYHGFVRHPEVHINPGNEDKATVIHEIGHHVSKQTGTDHSEYYTPHERGQEEGYADNYADTHFRDRKGRPNTEHKTYAGGRRDNIRTEQFYGGYHEMRPKPESGPEDQYPDIDSKTHPDGSRDVPLLRKSYRMSEVEDKHGNPYFDEHVGVEVHPDALPAGARSEDVLPKHMADQRWITQDHKHDGYKRGLLVQEKQFGKGDQFGPELTHAIKGLFDTI